MHRTIGPRCVASVISVHPARRAGIASISTVENKGAEPLDIQPYFTMGTLLRQHRLQVRSRPSHPGFLHAMETDYIARSPSIAVSIPPDIPMACAISCGVTSKM